MVAAMNKLTARQQAVIDELEAICRRNVVRYKGKCDHLYQTDMRKLTLGDAASVFGNGGLTFQVGRALSIKAGAVLSTFKALESKGMVIRETSFPEYQRALYWWPVGLAEKLCVEFQLNGGPV
jgi:hypothetical protein